MAEGTIIVHKPSSCECRLLIDGKRKDIGAMLTKAEIRVGQGEHMLNAGIVDYDDVTSPDGMDTYTGHGFAEWAWESDRKVHVGTVPLHIRIRRKWHLLKSATAEAEIL